MKKPDLSIFDQINKEKPSWEKRYALIKEIFPSVENLNWSQIFKEDPDLMGDIINEISKASDASPGRPGKRPPVSRKTARDTYLSLSGQDYSLEPFHVTFRELTEGHSIRDIAHKSGLERNHVYRLMNGKEPDIYSIECIAQGFGKRPEYFLEYRVFFVITFLTNRLEKIPESSVHFFRKLAGIGRFAV